MLLWDTQLGEDDRVWGLSINPKTEKSMCNMTQKGFAVSFWKLAFGGGPVFDLYIILKKSI